MGPPTLLTRELLVAREELVGIRGIRLRFWGTPLIVVVKVWSKRVTVFDA